MLVDRAIATIGGPLGRFTEQDSLVTEYRFNWRGVKDRMVSQLDQDINIVAAALIIYII